MSKLPVLLAATLALLAAPTALAHAHVPVGDAYELTIGWTTEPPLVDQSNGVWLKVVDLPLGSGDVAPGESYSYTFRDAGTVTYHCHPHPWMRGNLTIEAASHDGGHQHGAHATPTTYTVDIIDGEAAGASAFVPENLTIKVGDTVTWVNKGTMPHTITEGDGESHDGHGHSHGSGESLVTGVEKTLKVEVSIAGKTRTFDLKPAFREPGVYTADFIPTVPGVYTARFVGTIGDVEVDVTQELQKVESLSGAQFPEAGPSAFETQKKLDQLAAKVTALEAGATTQANTNAELTDQNDVPAAGPVLVIGGLALVAFALRRRG